MTASGRPGGAERGTPESSGLRRGSRASTSGLLGGRTPQPQATGPSIFIVTSPIVVADPLPGIRIGHLDVLELVTGNEARPALQASRPVHVDLQLVRVPMIDPGRTDDRALLAGALQAGFGVFDPDVRRPELQVAGSVVLARCLVRSSRARTCCTPSIGGCSGFGTLPLSSIRRPNGST